MSVQQSSVLGWVSRRVTSRHLAFFGLGWVALFFILPVCILVVESLNFSEGHLLQAYEQALSGIYVDAFVRSFYYGAVTTVTTVVLAYLLSYYLVFAAKRVRLLLTLVVIPLWIAYIIRYFGILLFLSPAGPFTEMTGIEVDILFSTPAVILGLANVYLPFAVLPIYNSINSIDDELIDASRVLGASQLRAVSTVVFPLSLPGLVAAGLIVFILAAGSFLAPAVLGGPQQTMIANLIAKSFLEIYNIQLASALAVIYTVLLVTFLTVFNRFFDLKEVLGNI